MDAGKQTETEQSQYRNSISSSSYCPRPALNNLVIASETVDCSNTAKIGAIFNNSLSMFPHVTAEFMQVFFLSSSKYFQYSSFFLMIHPKF